MTDFWSVGEEQKILRHGEFGLTVVHAPFPGALATLPAHDPDRAREFVGAFGTVDAVLAELGLDSATDPAPFATRRDLERVSVGCWGNVTRIVDPALGHRGDSFPVLEQSEALRERFPDAVIIASATIDYNMTYGAWVISHPSGASVFAAGWHGEENWDFDGDVGAVVEAFGIPAEALAEKNVDLDEDINGFYWEGLERLALGRVAPLHLGGRTMSVFRVRHTEDTTFDMEETWLEEPGAF
jgi:hypothetical protein